MSIELVRCSSCQRLTPKDQTCRSETAEFIDGDESNLDPSNLRKTGEVYECHLCVQVGTLEESPLVIHSEPFRQGYRVGVAEAKRWWQDFDAVTDEDIVASFKRTFEGYGEAHNEEAMQYSIGSTIGLVVGLTVHPVLEVFHEMQENA